jgi:hypothetical protein
MNATTSKNTSVLAGDRGIRLVLFERGTTSAVSVKMEQHAFRLLSVLLACVDWEVRVLTATYVTGYVVLCTVVRMTIKTSKTIDAAKEAARDEARIFHRYKECDCALTEYTAATTCLLPCCSSISSICFAPEGQKKRASVNLLLIF